jgi:hypothetical protein
MIISKAKTEDYLDQNNEPMSPPDIYMLNNNHMNMGHTF